MSDGASWNTCTGTFYDSGGPGNEYNDNEDMTATICPAGGGGGGLATSVYFVSFDVAHHDDELVIHNGTSTWASVLGTGDDNNSLAGETFTATGPSGCLTFHWTSDNPAEAAGWVAEVITGSDAGSNATEAVCSNQSPFSLFDQLGGDPDMGGSWTGPSGPHGPQYDPATDPGGVYTYTVLGGTACADMATVTITHVSAPYAGEDGTLLICGNSAPVDLIASLGASPATGGTWTGPNGPHDGTYDPATDPPGSYTYTVVGITPCPNASATVTVIVNDPDAGTNATLAVCSGQASFQLIGALGGSPDAGGSWTGPGGPHGPLYDPGTEPGGTFTYTVSDGNCVASATLIITNVPGPNAGENGTLTICAASPPAALINSLGGSPSSGGTWTGPNGPHDGSYDPDTDPPGNYIYTVAASAPCSAASATVTVSLSGPNAGTNATLAVCSGQAPFLLIGALGGTPETGGSWTGPGGAHGPVFNPGTEPGGTYTYTVSDGNCVAFSTLIITNVPGPDAGEDGTLMICEGSPPAVLFNSLGGSPSSGGTWSGPNGAHDGSYDPDTDPPGNYIYTVVGTSPCPAATATVTVITNGPDAGLNASITACTGQPTFALIDALGGTPEPGGSWTGPNGSHGPLFDPGSEQGGVYTYTVADGDCIASSSVTITMIAGPDAGENGTLMICALSPATPLITILGGFPASGGTWTGPNGPHDGTYDPGTDPPGEYTYTVAGTAPCSQASATVTVINNGPYAGISMNLTLCSGQSPFSLFEALGGNPDVGGTWTGPEGSHGEQYDPGEDPGGVYIYSVMNGSLCTDTATITITNMPGPDAGDDGVLQICEVSPPVDLINSLTGTPESGGTWTGPAGPHDGSYDPTSDPPGGYVYTVYGTAPCPYASATVTVVLAGVPDAGTDGELIVCDTVTALELISGLGGSPDVSGVWEDLDGSGGLSNGMLTTSGLSADVYTFLYTVAVTGCNADSAVLTVQVLGSVEVTDLERQCNEVDRTSVISFTVIGGDPQTYTVLGIPGTLEATEPYLFTSDPIPDSVACTITVADQNGCATVSLVLDPCHYEPEIFIPESFSPNGDGINEAFLIPGLEDFPGNEIHIYNRWGAELYTARNYHRTRGWDGGGGTGNVYVQGDLPTGTYYYILDLGDGSEAHRGFIYLNR